MSGNVRLAQRNGHFDQSAGSGAAADLHFAIEQARALLHADQAEAMCVRTTARQLHIEATAVVGDDQLDAVVLLAQLDPYRAGLGVPADVDQRLLGDPVERFFHARRQPRPHQHQLEIDRRTSFGGEALAERFQRGRQRLALQRAGAQIQHRSASLL